MKKNLSAFTLLFLSTLIASAQTNYRKNAINVNVTRLAVNEINLGYEHFFTNRKSLELAASLVYVNDWLESEADNWTNSKYLSEHGFGVRLHYKVYRNRTDESNWVDYIAGGLNYKYLYYNTQWFSNSLTDNADKKYNELILQNRFRNKFSGEFLWGKVYNATNAFAIEIYYGAGVSATSVRRNDLARQPDDRIDDINILNYTDNRLYFRPSIQAGVKLRLNFQ